MRAPGSEWGDAQPRSARALRVVDEEFVVSVDDDMPLLVVDELSVDEPAVVPVPVPVVLEPVVPVPLAPMLDVPVPLEVPVLALGVLVELDELLGVLVLLL